MDAKKYFEPREFIDRVVKACQLDDVDGGPREALEQAIEKRLRERMTATILGSFEERDMAMLQKVGQDHPELDGIEAIMLIALNMPDLQAKLQEAVQDLYEELTYDAGRIDQMINK